MNLFWKLPLLALLVYFVPKFCHEKTDGFTLTKIHSNLPYNSKWVTTHPPNEPLENIMSQKFTYLTSGGQSYVFVSEDQKYVLKFFKHHLRRVPLLWAHLPLPQKWDQKRNLQQAKREKKLHRDFFSYKLAFEELPEETGLIFIHLNRTDNLNQKVKIIDRLNIEHLVDLDQVEFVVQKKGELSFSYFEKLIQEQDLIQAKKGIDSICNVILKRCKKGIYDEDAKIHRNFGFLENEAIILDAGRFKLDARRKSPHIQQQDLQKITKPLQTYLETLSPELAQYLEKKTDV